MSWTFLTAGIALGSWWALQRARLGRLVVLGPGGERLLHSLAGGHRVDPFAGGERATLRVQVLDGPARDIRLLREPPRRLPGAIRSAGVGPRLCHRSATRPVHSHLPRHRRGRRSHPLRGASGPHPRRRRLRVPVARDTAAREQRRARRGGGCGDPGHAVSACVPGARMGDAVRGASLVQPDVRPLHAGACRARGVRSAHPMATGPHGPAHAPPAARRARDAPSRDSPPPAPFRSHLGARPRSARRTVGRRLHRAEPLAAAAKRVRLALSRSAAWIRRHDPRSPGSGRVHPGRRPDEQRQHRARRAPLARRDDRDCRLRIRVPRSELGARDPTTRPAGQA